MNPKSKSYKAKLYETLIYSSSKTLICSNNLHLSLPVKIQNENEMRSICFIIYERTLISPNRCLLTFHEFVSNSPTPHKKITMNVHAKIYLTKIKCVIFKILIKLFQPYFLGFYFFGLIFFGPIFWLLFFGSSLRALLFRHPFGVVLFWPAIILRIEFYFI